MSKAAELAALIGSQTAQSNRNLIINGAMQVAQRSVTSTGVGADGISGLHNVDRWRIDIGATSAGRVTMAQTAVTDLAGFANSMKISCTTADTSIAAGEALIFDQRIEGQNIQRLTATSTSTKAFTLSFYAKSNASRAIASEVVFVNGTNRQMSKVHTIGTSWSRYTMTVPAASSTQIDDDNSYELGINFWLHAGSTYTGGTINDDALDSITNANRAAGIGSIFASTDNFFEITGVQLELGEQATPFEHRSFDDDLAACQRYYVQLLKSDSTKELVISGGQSGATNFNCFLPYPMRAAPTITWPTSSGIRGEGTTVNISSIASTMDTNNYVHFNCTITSGLTANTASFAYAFQGSTNLDAEL
jgi:hypothetical protein